VHRRPGQHLRAAADPCPRQQGAAGPDGGLGADLDLAEVQHVAVDPVAGQVDLGLDRRVPAEREHPGHRWQCVQVDTAADLRAERPGVVGDPGRAGQVRGTGGVGQVLRRPQPDVHAAAARVVARLDPAQQHPGAGDRDRHPPGRCDQHQPAGREPPPRHGRQPAEAARRRGDHLVEGQAPGEEAGSDDRLQEQGQHDLQHLGAARDRPDGLASYRGLGERAVRVEPLGQRAQPRETVDVGHGRLGVPLPQRRHQLRRRQAATAVQEEVVVRPGHRRPEHPRPPLGQPPGRSLQYDALSALRGLRPDRPRQCVPVDLPGRPGGQRVHCHQERHQRRRELLPQPVRRRRGVDAVDRNDVADQDLVAGGGGLDGSGGATDAGESLEGGVHLAELDAAATELDLLVGPALEDQAFGLVADQVAAAVRAVPAQ